MDKEHGPSMEGAKNEAAERRQRERELIAKLIEVTRNDKDVVGWNQRLAEKARELGVPTENVAWNDTPREVANRIMRLALTQRTSEQITGLLEGYTKEEK